MDEGTIVADTVSGTRCAFLGELHRAEREIAERLTRLAATEPPWRTIDSDHALEDAEKEAGLALAPQQADAARLALRSKVTIVTGGPGVGKTTLIDTIPPDPGSEPRQAGAVRADGPGGTKNDRRHRNRSQDDPPTPRDRPRDRGFKRNASNPINCDLLVIDETSMVDVMLMRALLAAVPDHAALLIVGDTDQLPSVGPGQVLADMISSAAVPVVRLTEIFRQAAQSRIVTTAHNVNRGVIPDLSRQDRTSDFHFLRADDPETAAARIVELVTTRIPEGFGLDPIEDIQVLCPMNRGTAGARTLNMQLQTALNPIRERKVERFGWTFAAGDKVMQTVNDYRRDVYNGDTGKVIDVNPETGELTARFHGEEHVYAFGELDALVPAYAATVHKSQGSEYPAVVIPVLTQHYVMLQRNLLYTALTRAKQVVVLVGQKKAVAMAVRNAAGRKRWSKLNEQLRVLAERKPKQNPPPGATAGQRRDSEVQSHLFTRDSATR